MPPSEPTSRPRTVWRVLRILAIVMVAYALLVGCQSLFFLASESAVPARSALPDLPDNVSAQYEDVYCGSGGCYLVFNLSSSDGRSLEELAASVNYIEGCAARNLLTLRQVCSYVEIRGDLVSVVVLYHRPL